MKLAVLVTTAALLEYVWLGYRVALARERYGVEPPAVTYVSDPVGALLGAVFIAGRAVYAHLYVQDPPRRRVVVLLSFPVGLGLLVG